MSQVLAAIARSIVEAAVFGLVHAVEVLNFSYWRKLRKPDPTFSIFFMKRNMSVTHEKILSSEENEWAGHTDQNAPFHPARPNTAAKDQL